MDQVLLITGPSSRATPAIGQSCRPSFDQRQSRQDRLTHIGWWRRRRRFMSNLADTKRVAFDFHPAKGKQARAASKRLRQVLAGGGKKKGAQNRLNLPAPEFGWGGDPSAAQGWGWRDFKKKGLPTTAHTAATAFPFVAGPSLGYEGAMIGHDLHGGGPFCFDPWELYRKGMISGMSMLLFGQVGTGKSTLAKSMAVRLVLYGRKLSVASDKKGEWTKVVRDLGGSVIQVGPGLDARINPLDEGKRPSLTVQGLPMTDEHWRIMVRARRMSIMVTLVKILTDREPDSAEHLALSDGLDMATDAASADGRVPVIPDLIHALEQLRETNAVDKMRSDAANIMSMTLRRMTSGDLGGMFDGESTVSFDVDAPATSIDTSSARGANPISIRVITACVGSWMEAMVTNSDSGQRLVIYEEGWDSLSSEADLTRMVEQWKLARSYGLFNVMVLHKVTDLDMAGAEGSKMVAMAESLLADADIKVIYRQDSAALKITADKMELSDRERTLLKTLNEGTGLWRVGEATFEVANTRTKVEIPLFDTDQRMDTGQGDSKGSQDAPDDQIAVDTETNDGIEEELVNLMETQRLEPTMSTSTGHQNQKSGNEEWGQ